MDFADMVILCPIVYYTDYKSVQSYGETDGSLFFYIIAHINKGSLTGLMSLQMSRSAMKLYLSTDWLLDVSTTV